MEAGTPGAIDNLVKVVAHSPVEVAGSQFAGRDDTARVARAARGHIQASVPMMRVLAAGGDDGGGGVAPEEVALPRATSNVPTQA